MQEIITIISIFVGMFILFQIERIGNKKQNRINKETELRLGDTKLQKFYTEMNTDRNDGWTKQHYKFLYEARLKELMDGNR